MRSTKAEHSLTLPPSRIARAQASCGLTWTSEEFEFVQRFDQQQHAREEAQNSAKLKCGTTTTTSSSHTSKGASGKGGAKGDKEPKSGGGEKFGRGHEGEERAEDASNRKRRAQITHKWRSAADTMEEFMQQWEGLRGLAQASMREVEQGTSSQRAQLDATLQLMSAKHARTLAHQSLRSAASKATEANAIIAGTGGSHLFPLSKLPPLRILHEGLGIGPSCSRPSAAQEGVWSSDNSSDSDELFADPSKELKGRPGECLSRPAGLPACLIDRRTDQEKDVWKKVMERRAELRRILESLGTVEAEQEAFKKRPGKDGKVAALKALNSEKMDLVKKKEELAIEAVRELRVLYSRRDIRRIHLDILQKARLRSRDFGLRGISREIDEFRDLKRFLPGSGGLQHVHALQEDVRLNPRRDPSQSETLSETLGVVDSQREDLQVEQTLRGIVDPESPSLEAQQQQYDKVMTERVLGGLEEDLMGPSSPSTSDLLAKGDSWEGILEEVEESAYISKPRRPQVPLADSDSESNVTMGLESKHLSRVALMHEEERAARTERGSTSTNSRHLRTGDAEQLKSGSMRLLDEIGRLESGGHASREGGSGCSLGEDFDDGEWLGSLLEEQKSQQQRQQQQHRLLELCEQERELLGLCERLQQRQQQAQRYGQLEASERLLQQHRELLELFEWQQQWQQPQQQQSENAEYQWMNMQRHQQHNPQHQRPLENTEQHWMDLQQLHHQQQRYENTEQQGMDMEQQQQWKQQLESAQLDMENALLHLQKQRPLHWGTGEARQRGQEGRKSGEDDENTLGCMD